MSQASAAGYADAWRGLPPRSDDEQYNAAYQEGLADAKKAARFRPINVAASKAAVGRARSRAGGNNTFIFAGKTHGRLPA